MPSQQQTSRTPLTERDEFRTPGYLFEWAERRFGPMDVDLAATEDNALCTGYLSPEQDALTVPWHEIWERGWCNPPYSRLKPWVTKAIQEARKGFETVMLLPSLNGDKRDSSILRYATEVVFIVGRVAFLTPAGVPKVGNPRGSCVALFNQHGCSARIATISFVGLKDLPK